jgi:hypothetical protein
LSKLRLPKADGTSGQRKAFRKNALNKRPMYTRKDHAIVRIIA